MSTATSGVAIAVAATLPIFAAGVGLDANPIAAGISGAALASVFKLEAIDQASLTKWKAVVLASKFIATFFAGAAATIYGSPYICRKLVAEPEPEARVLIYLIVGLIGSIAIRLIAVYDKEIFGNLWRLLTNLKLPQQPPTPPAPPIGM